MTGSGQELGDLASVVGAVVDDVNEQLGAGTIH